MNKLCRAKGLKLDQPFTGDTLIKEFVGQNFRGMMRSLQERYGFELPEHEAEQYVHEEENIIVNKLSAHGLPCAGVDAQLEALEASGRYVMAVVSSSAMRRVVASLKVTGQDKYFGNRVYSAASSLDKPTTKPNPAIYLHAMKMLGKEAAECVAIEDSKSGTTAAVRADIKTIGYVGPYDADQREHMRKVLTDAGACIIMEHWDEFPACLEKIEAGSV